MAYEFSKLYGKKILEARFDKENNCFLMMFAEPNGLLQTKIYDRANSCCELRFMTCDDDVSQLNGKILIRLTVKESEPINKGHGDIEEIEFLEVIAEDCIVTFATHNEHNGYYGGFNIMVEETLFHDSVHETSATA